MIFLNEFLKIFKGIEYPGRISGKKGRKTIMCELEGVHAETINTNHAIISGGNFKVIPGNIPS